MAADLVLVADCLVAERVAMPALSAISNLVYWQAVADERGGPAAVWGRVASPDDTAPVRGE